jgi:hypothetical protein
MEIFITKEHKYCYSCKCVKNKKFEFIKGNKNCKICINNLIIKDNIECDSKCLLCIWSGSSLNFKNHNCILDIDNNIKKNKIKNSKEIYKLKKDNPYLIIFS